MLVAPDRRIRLTALRVAAFGLARAGRAAWRPVLPRRAGSRGIVALCVPGTTLPDPCLGFFLEIAPCQVSSLIHASPGAR